MVIPSSFLQSFMCSVNIEDVNVFVSTEFHRKNSFFRISRSFSIKSESATHKLKGCPFRWQGDWMFGNFEDVPKRKFINLTPQLVIPEWVDKAGASTIKRDCQQGKPFWSFCSRQSLVERKSSLNIPYIWRYTWCRGCQSLSKRSDVPQKRNSGSVCRGTKKK